VLGDIVWTSTAQLCQKLALLHPLPACRPAGFSVFLQSIASQAQASATAGDDRAAAGSTSRPGSGSGGAAGANAAAEAAAAAATDQVLDQLAGLQQLVRAEAHKQQEVFDSTLKVR
jgi:hypothetical protein